MKFFFQDFQVGVLKFQNYEYLNFLNSHFFHMNSNKNASNYKVITFEEIFQMLGHKLPVQVLWTLVLKSLCS
jgi:hypothetical protein